MKNKTKCFAVATAVLLAFCLVFMAPVGAATLYVYPDGTEVPNSGYASLEDAVKAANAGDTIILKSGNHYAENTGPINDVYVATQIDIGSDDTGLIITGESNTKYYLNTKNEDNSYGRGLGIYANDVVISNINFVATKNIYGPFIAQCADNLTVQNCGFEISTGVSNIYGLSTYFINGAIGNYKITIDGNHFKNNGDLIWTVYSGYCSDEHTSLQTITNNVFEGNLLAGLSGINGNYIITGNTFNIADLDENTRSGIVYGVKLYVTNNEVGDNPTKQITGNTFGDNVDSAVALLPLNTVTPEENKYPTLSENKIKETNHLIEVSLNVFGTFTEIPEIDGAVYSYGYMADYQNIGELEAGVTPLVPGVNLPGSTWTGDVENGYTLTFTEDGTYKVMGGFAVQANGITVPSGKTITLDLNGKTISSIKHNSARAAVIANKGELTIKDTANTGMITSSFDNPDIEWDPEGFPTYATNTIANEGFVTIESGKLENHSPAGGASYVVDNTNGGSLTVSGGVLYGEHDNAIRLFANNDGTKDQFVTITGGDITGKRAIWIQLPGSDSTVAPKVTVTVSDGKLVSNEDTYNLAIYSYSDGNSFDNTKIVISGGIFDGNIALTGADTITSIETIEITGGEFNGKYGMYTYGNDEDLLTKGSFIKGGTFVADPSSYVPDSYEAVLVGGKYVVAEEDTLSAAISAADIGFDSVKVGYTQPAEKTVTIKNDGQRDVTLNLPTSEKYDISLSATTLKVDETVDLTIQPKENLPVGNYAETITVTTEEGAETTFEVSFLVYQPSSGGSSKPVEEPVEPEIPEEPEVPTEEPVAGEVTVETEVTDGGEVEFEAPVEEPEAGEGETPAADEDEAKITGVVLPTGTDSEVTFVPVSEQAAPEGKETQTKKVFEINVPTYEKGKAAVIKFTMTVAELEADGKEAADVALWHFDEETGEWTKLVTSYTIVDGVVYFEAITNDFSPFAIVYEDEPVDEPVDEPETPASPAPVLGLIAALGAAVALRRK